MIIAKIMPGKNRLQKFLERGGLIHDENSCFSAHFEHDFLIKDV